MAGQAGPWTGRTWLVVAVCGVGGFVAGYLAVHLLWLVTT